MVMVSAVPSTLIPSGSSPARKSERAAVLGWPLPDSEIRRTRRRAVRPDNDPPFAAVFLTEYTRGKLEIIIATEPGMTVHTDSERVRTSRRMVLEFLASSTDVTLAAPEVRRWMERYGADPGPVRPCRPAARGRGARCGSPRRAPRAGAPRRTRLPSR
jgi:hypothetical protein